MIKDKKKSIKYIKDSKKGITLVALVVTIIVLLILAGVTITILMGDNGIIRKAQEAAESTNTAVENELQGMNDLGDKMNSILGGAGTGGDDETADPTENWDLTKVTKVLSDDGKVVPVPIGFTKSTVSGEGSVDTGFVIKQGSDGSLTSGINEFVWVPVSDPSEMFGTDGTNSLGKLYNFGTSSAPNNPPTERNWTETGGVMSWTASSGSGSYREPDIVTGYDGSDATADASDFSSEIGSITGAQFKAQLQQEFEDMRDSVETYGGFYIGRYETGNLSQTKAVVQKNNEDIGNQNWYTMYNKCKTIAQGTQGTSSMIWGCQWDATMKWFLDSSDPEVVEYVTDSTGKGNYSGSLLANGTGSNDDYSVNKIYDMAGNVLDWTLEAYDTRSRVFRRRHLQSFRFQLSGFLP